MIMQTISIQIYLININFLITNIKNKRKELEELESADQALLQRLDLMKFQLEELTEASLKEGEVDQLESDIKRIQNSEN